MQKYDDFGRPIYETAEEYNRAHGRGGSAYTHEGLEGNVNQQNATKKAKTLVIGIIAFIVALNIVIILSMSNMVGSRVAEPERDYVNTWEEDYVEYPNEAETPLPDGFEKFSYNGQFYTLPTTYKEIAKMGYDLDRYEATDMIPSGFWETMS